MKFGEFVHAARIKKGLTLREFCRMTEIDPGNWSKTERGLQTPPKSRAVLTEVAETLGFQEDSEEFQTLLDLASISFIPENLLDDSSIVEKLPVFFRTLRGEKPTRQELEELLEKVREG
jgi:transcriptional regulator with XRE-family HTH domain